MVLYLAHRNDEGAEMNLVGNLWNGLVENWTITVPVFLFTFGAMIVITLTSKDGE